MNRLTRELQPLPQRLPQPLPLIDPSPRPAIATVRESFRLYYVNGFGTVDVPVGTEIVVERVIEDGGLLVVSCEELGFHGARVAAERIWACEVVRDEV